jgi:hypothetical protein
MPGGKKRAERLVGKRGSCAVWNMELVCLNLRFKPSMLRRHCR